MKLLKTQISKKDLLRIGVPVAALALVASVVVGRERPAGPVIEAAPRAEARVRGNEDLDLSPLFRQEEISGKPSIDPFARRSFAPAGQPQQAAAPQAPVAPPLPFRYVGKLIEDGHLKVFLARGEDSFTVSPAGKRGQKLDGEYRIDKVTETKIVFTYLPLKTRQTLDIPAVN
ncbi:MAG TPA: hypothetical protein VF262_12035 [Burkholderiales bacterium]|jgi:hypothetical protein